MSSKFPRYLIAVISVEYVTPEQALKSRKESLSPTASCVTFEYEPRSVIRTGKMTFQHRASQELSSWKTELASWKSPPKIYDVSPVPQIGTQAPTSTELPFPRADGKPVIITFLRHCGCPFAEKTFLDLRKLAGRHPSVNFIAISHSDQSTTDKWVIDIGGEWDLSVLVDTERKLYAQWGLGVASTWHVINPWSMYNSYALARKEKSWGTLTESGSKWQSSGSFAVDIEGVVRWSAIAKTSDDSPDFNAALEALGLKD